MSLDVYLKDPTATYEVDWLYGNNITHNLTTMADKAGIYEYLWRPDEINVTQANQMISPLKNALERMRDKPNYYKSFNPTNDWGNYEVLISFVESYLSACEKYPKSIIEISR